MTYLKISFLLLPLIVLSSCDAMLHMTYSVENKTNQNITLFIPDFQYEDSDMYGKFRDTVLTLKPDESVIIGSNTKIDFPFATKNIYKANPGSCGIERLDSDSTIRFGCTKDEWKYKRRNSSLRIK